MKKTDLLEDLKNSGVRQLGQFENGTITLEFRDMPLSLPPPLDGKFYYRNELRSIAKQWFDDTEDHDAVELIKLPSH